MRQVLRVLILVLPFSTTLALANSANSITWTSYSINPQSPVLAFNLSGPGYIAAGFGELDDSYAFCQEFCVPSDFKTLRGTDILRSAEGGVTLNGQALGWYGGIEFKAVAFHSSLAPTGVMTLFGLASGSITLHPWDPNNPCCTVGPPIQMSGMWHFAATYVPWGPNAEGLYLQSMQLTPVPEPGSIWLLGLGVAFLGWRLKICRTLQRSCT